MMGDGVIEIARLREAVEAQGYHGPVECEIFNQSVWDAPIDETMRRMMQTFVEWC
jgi:hypothetical protein